MKTLDQHLAHVMGERAGRGDSTATKTFHDELAGSPALIEQANIRLRHFTSPAGQEIMKRDHVSRMHHLILKEALENV